MERAAASAHLARIGARSRPAGGDGAADARRYCGEVLQRAGFLISEHSFEYSAFPASWGTPIAGVVAMLTAISLFVGRAGRAPTLVNVAIATLIVALAALGMLGRKGVLDFPVMRRRGVNLEAVRQGEEPRVWLVAHIDSKWQPVSMIARVVGIVGTAIGLVGMTVLAVGPMSGRFSEAVAIVVLALTCLASVPLVLSSVGDKNTGALDNASGVAAVLEAAEALPVGARVGVLISDAEEMALAGARAWVRSKEPVVALNCDSVDDMGKLTVMYSGRRPASLLSSLAAVSTEDGGDDPLRIISLIPGILTDSVVLTGAGWEAVTLSRGNARTLSRIHTSNDTLDAMRGTGITGAARVLARIATELG